MTQTTDLADKLAMWIGGGLIILAIPVMGLIVTLTGSMSAMYAYTLGEESGYVLAPALAPEGAEIVASPLFSPNMRAWLIAIGLTIWGLYAIYRVFAPRTPERRKSPAAEPADD
ncbi:hypothetical protein ACFQH6_15375 [Halobacteriaceae archaeon GCM10025711]